MKNKKKLALESKSETPKYLRTIDQLHVVGGSSEDMDCPDYDGGGGGNKGCWCNCHCMEAGVVGFRLGVMSQVDSGQMKNPCSSIFVTSKGW